jgi:hypothetical protein
VISPAPANPFTKFFSFLAVIVEILKNNCTHCGYKCAHCFGVQYELMVIHGYSFRVKWLCENSTLSRSRIPTHY